MAVNCLPLSNRKCSILPCKTTWSTIESGRISVSAPSVMRRRRRKLHMYPNFSSFFFSRKLLWSCFFFPSVKSSNSKLFPASVVWPTFHTSYVLATVWRRTKAPPTWRHLALLTPGCLTSQIWKLDSVTVLLAEGEVMEVGPTPPPKKHMQQRVLRSYLMEGNCL